MPKLVPDWCQHGCPPPEGHQCDAKYILVGEAPGQKEDEYSQPFIGPTWTLLCKWLDWLNVPLQRRDFYITNVYPYRPPHNKIGAIPQDQIAFWTQRLWERLSRLSGPSIVIPTGNTALRALFGEHRAISDWRGSILSIELNGRGVKTIPTIHPAATFKQPILTKFCLADWKRIWEDSQFPELRLPVGKTIVEPSEDEFGQFLVGLDRAEMNVVDGIAIPTVIAVDVETDRKSKELLCVGFSYDESTALVLPTTQRALSSSATLQRMLSYARLLCAHPEAKVLQNGQFDAFHLARNRMALEMYDWDLMEMDHAYDPNDGGDTGTGDGQMESDGIRISMRSLAVLASLHWRHPFWKHQGKTDGAGFRWDQLFAYNGIDCRGTRAIFDPLYVRLAKEGMV